MALNKKPAFETETNAADTVVMEKPVPVQKAAYVAPDDGASSAPTESVKVEASTAIAVAATRTSANPDAINALKAFKAEIESMYEGADFSYGSHRVFKAKDGAIKEMSGDKLKLGRWVKGRLMAWARRYEISPGEEGAAAAGFVAYSNDGVTITSAPGEEQKAWIGKPVEDYLEYLRKEEDFSKASKRETLVTEVAVMGCDSNPGYQEIVQITLASSSIRTFSSFESKLAGTARAVSMGLAGYSMPADPFMIYFICEDADKGSKSWTKIRIDHDLPAKL